MPGYLDNVWGDQQAVQDISNSVGSNLAQLVHFRQQQAQFQQEHALKAAMLALEQQKTQMQAPLIAAQTGLDTSQAEHFRTQTLAAQNLARDQDAMARVIGPQYINAHPIHQQMQPGLPYGNDLFLTTNMGAALANMGTPVNANSPYMAGTTAEADNVRNTAAQHAIASRAMLAHPETAAMLYNGVQMHPGMTQYNPLTSQAEYTAPDEMRDFNLASLDEARKGRIAYEQARAATDAQRADAYDRQVDKPANESDLKYLMRMAEEKKRNRGLAPAAPTTNRLPTTGEVRNGYRFKGGDPSQESNWEVVK